MDADRLSEGLRVRCVAAIERYRAEHGTAPNRLVIETTGQVLATAQTGEERAPPARHSAWEGRAGVEEAGTEAGARLAQLHAASEVPVAPYADGPQVMSVVRRALARAGYAIELGE